MMTCAEVVAHITGKTTLLPAEDVAAAEESMPHFESCEQEPCKSTRTGLYAVDGRIATAMRLRYKELSPERLEELLREARAAADLAHAREDA